MLRFYGFLRFERLGFCSCCGSGGFLELLHHSYVALADWPSGAPEVTLYFLATVRRAPFQRYQLTLTAVLRTIVLKDTLSKAQSARTQQNDSCIDLV